MVGQIAIGMDIGSTCAKTVMLDQSGTVIRRDLRPTGWSSADTAEAIRREFYEYAEKYSSSWSVAPEQGCRTMPGTENQGYQVPHIRCVATGYGRVSVPFADKCVTEISCHAKGAVYLFQADDLNVIDIGGQDTKLIRIENGSVSDFVMNDKCSAGTGRFLEVMANTLGVSPEELCRMAGIGRETHISSLCTVFAEAEVINLIGRGVPREDIAFAVTDSIVRKVQTQAGKMAFSGKTLCLTGGLCDFEIIREMLGAAFRQTVETMPDARYAGAIGAALYALAL